MWSSSNSSLNMKPTHWSPWLVASIAAICTAILVLSYPRLFTHLCGITWSRTQVRRRQLLVLDESNRDDLSLQFQSRRLEFLSIQSLPVIQFEEKRGGANQTSDTDCAVCLVDFKEGEWLRQLPNCSHSFHISCIDTWFLKHSSCPLCRSEVQILASDDHEFSISVHTLPQTLNREDFFRERAAHYQILPSDILYNSGTTHQPQEGN